jgi:hypothetical protein
MVTVEAQSLTTTSMDDSVRALEALVIENADLQELEQLLDPFNIFEAIGVVRQELRHSDFLAFLLDPQQNHGLGDLFARRLLQRILRAPHIAAVPITPLDLDLLRLDEAEVRREWQNIDILLLDESRRLAVIIENKIDSGEQGNQLCRYWATVQQHFPGFGIIGIFLTPEGQLPSDERYIPASYQLIRQLIEDLAQNQMVQVGPDVRLLMSHYAQMLRRNIVDEPEIAGLCRRIYQKHRRALDLIYEYRPDRQQELWGVIEKLVRERRELVLDHSSKSYIRFCHAGWDVPRLREGYGWTPSGRTLLFEFRNEPTRLQVQLVLGPGPEESRKHIFDMALQHRPPFNPSSRSLSTKWNTLFSRLVLNPRLYEDRTLEELEADVRKQWSQFVEQTLPEIVKTVAEEVLTWPTIASTEQA